MKKIISMTSTGAVGLVLLGILAGGVGGVSAGGTNNQARFSSVYSDLQAGCKPLGDDNAPDRQHFAMLCKGAGKYQIQIQDTAGSLVFLILTPESDDSIQFEQALDYDTKRRKVEWRMADGVPFAVILRTNKYKTRDGLIDYPVKITGEFLSVKGLKGFENIDFEVNAKTPGANQKARRLADAGYEKAVKNAKVGGN